MKGDKRIACMRRQAQIFICKITSYSSAMRFQRLKEAFEASLVEVEGSGVWSGGNRFGHSLRRTITLFRKEGADIHHVKSE